MFTWHTELNGFGVRIIPSGVASFILKYRNAEGRQRKLALARAGTMTPEGAAGGFPMNAVGKASLGHMRIVGAASGRTYRRSATRTVTLGNIDAGEPFNIHLHEGAYQGASSGLAFTTSAPLDGVLALRHEVGNNVSTVHIGTDDARADVLRDLIAVLYDELVRPMREDGQ